MDSLSFLLFMEFHRADRVYGPMRCHGNAANMTPDLFIGGLHNESSTGFYLLVHQPFF